MRRGEHQHPLTFGVDSVDDPIVPRQDFSPSFCREFRHGSADSRKMADMRGCGSNALDLQLCVAQGVSGNKVLDRAQVSQRVPCPDYAENH